MSNPNNAIWLLIGLVCIWPTFLFFLGYLLATATHKKWIRLDTSNAPKINWKRHEH